MWTVTVDSNMPFKSVKSSESGGLIFGNCLKECEKDGDVEKLLGSPSPIRTRSSSVGGRPPSSAHTSALRSRSPSSFSKKYSMEAVISKNLKDQQQLTLDQATAGHQTKDVGCRPNSRKEPVMRHTAAYGQFGISGSPQIPFKADHSTSTSLLDPYSGISATTTPSSYLTSDDIKPRITHRLTRSSSLSRLNKLFNGESMLLTDSVRDMDVIYRDARGTQSSLEYSESQRNVLMHKLKDAQATLDMQSERLKILESSAKDNSVLVESLKFKEKKYRNTISELEASEKEKQILQMENIHLQEDMQNRINALDYQLRSLKSQHYSTESNNNKNITLLDHTTTALSLLEEENSKLKQLKEKLQSEILLLKESFDVTKARCTAMETDKQNMRNESGKLKEVNNTLSRKVQEMTDQIKELQNLLKAVRDENEHLFSILKTSTEDKSWTVQQIHGYQDTISHLKVRLSSTSADRDRLFQEKLNMNSKFQQMLFDKEQLMKTQLVLDDQFGEHLSQHSNSTALKFKKNMREIDSRQGLATATKMNKELSAERSLIKTSYQHALEQIAVLDHNLSVLQSQYDLSEQEKRSLQQELNKLNQGTRSKQSVEQQPTTTESEKLHNDHEKLQLEYSSLKHEYDSLVAKHHQLFINSGQDGKVVGQETQEVVKWKKEKDAMQKQTAFLQGQILLMEGSKKRADEQIIKLTSEIEDLLVQLKEKNRGKSSLTEEVHSFGQEVDMLKLQPEKAKGGQTLQNNFTESFKESSLEDKRSDLQQVKDKLHNLSVETDQKNQIIENLKLELKSSKEMAETKQNEVEKLNNVVEEIKKENQALLQSVKGNHNSMVASVSKEPEKGTVKLSQSVKTLQEKLLEAVRSNKKNSYSSENSTFQNEYQNLQSTNDVPISQVPEKSSSEVDIHLQNLLSTSQGQINIEDTSPQQVVKSLPRYEPPRPLSKGLSSSPKAYMWQKDAAGSPTETIKENENSLSQIIRPVKKLPPATLPKPSTILTSSPALSAESTSRDIALKSSAFNSSTISPSSTIQSTLTSVSSSTSMPGLVPSKSYLEGQRNSQAQSDIKVLINQFDEMVTF